VGKCIISTVTMVPADRWAIRSTRPEGLKVKVLQDHFQKAMERLAGRITWEKREDGSQENAMHGWHTGITVISGGGDKTRREQKRSPSLSNRYNIVPARAMKRCVQQLAPLLHCFPLLVQIDRLDSSSHGSLVTKRAKGPKRAAKQGQTSLLLQVNAAPP
jgi:hypothetical protein